MIEFSSISVTYSSIFVAILSWFQKTPLYLQKINLFLLGAIIATLALYAVVDIWASQSSLEEDIEQSAVNTERRLGITLADSIWNFNVENS